MMNKNQHAICFAILAAILYALNAPFAKLLLLEIPPTLMAGLLYLGAGLGMFILQTFQTNSQELPLTRQELPYIIAMVVLDILAPICLMLGLSQSSAATVSLLNNFEIVMTSLIALCFFKEFISKRLWLAILLITLASILLSVEDFSSLQFSWGSCFVLLACSTWGLENNCTRQLSSKNPLQIVKIKGFASGASALLLGIFLGESFPSFFYILPALLLGFTAYGMSIYFYIYAQRYLGTAKTSAFYALAPFIGTFFSLIIFQELPTTNFLVAFGIMLMGTYLASTE